MLDRCYLFMYKVSKAEDDTESEMVSKEEMPDDTTENTPEDPGLKDDTEMPAEQEDFINKALELDSDSVFEHHDDDDDDLDKVDFI